MATDFKTAQPLEYYKEFLKENIRPDGRGLNEFRKTFLNIDSINTADGSALIRLGETMVVCGIKSELAEPTLEDPNKGYFIPNVDLPPLCSSEYLPGPPSDKSQVLSQQVLEYFSNSQLLNLDELCVQTKKLCWVLYADIVCISHDGNLLDAILIALLAALINTKLPVMKVNEETGEIVASDKDTFTLNIVNKAVSTSVALFNESLLLVDPTHEEEDLSNGVITVVMGANQKLVSLYKPGGVAVKDETLRSCIQASINRYEEVNNLLAKVTETVDR